MRAAQAAKEAAQREAELQAAKHKAAHAQLVVLQAEGKWRAAQAAVDSALFDEVDADGA